MCCDDELPKGVPRQRKWLKCNFPVFLDFIVFIYVYLTAMVIGDSAMVRQHDWMVQQAALITQSPSVHRLFIERRHKVEPASNMNMVASALSMFHLDSAVAVVNLVPDLAITLFLAYMTLRALHIAALSDPGEVPPEYEAPSWVTTPAKLQRNHELASTIAADRATNTVTSSPLVDSSNAVALKCAAPQLPKRLTMPGTSGPMLAGHSAASGARGQIASKAGRPYEPHYCGDCGHDRPLRTHHCRYCNVCVVRFDHHCDWIDNCVGQRNHKCFVLFIFYITLCIGHYLGMMTRYFNSKAIEFSPDGWIIFHLIIILVYCIVVIPCALLATIFLFNTVWGLVRDETTIESSYPARYGSMRGLAGPAIMTRVKSVMGQRVVLWLWPDLQPLKLRPGAAAAGEATPPTSAVGHGGKVTHDV
jgi:hypothetical protein